MSLKGAITIPGDKSISHRALIFGALANGTSKITNLLHSADVLSTWSCLEALGVKITQSADCLEVKGRGLNSLKQASGELNCGNSGTTMRLFMGLLSGQNFNSKLTGDASLSKRPMNRVAEPLRLMGANIELKSQNFAPIQLTSSQLTGISYALPIASAQVKSALILAALFAEGETRLTGLIHSRDHSERMLKLFGTNIVTTSNEICVTGHSSLQPRDIRVPGDPSTAAFWIGGASIVPGSELELHNVSLNPTRLGFIEAMKKMGANIQFEILDNNSEPSGNLKIKHADLKAINLSESDIPSLVDEIPILAIVCTQAHGTSEIRGASELRVKESDRLEAIGQNLKSMGVDIEILPDGFRVTGPQKLRGAAIKSHDDHRIAMAFSIASLISDGDSVIDHPECVSISYPDFYTHLRDLNQ